MMMMMIDDVSSWMMANRLQLNPIKTEVLWCSSARRQHQIATGPVRTGSISVQPVSDLGVFIDADLTLKSHVTATVIGYQYPWQYDDESLSSPP